MPRYHEPVLKETVLQYLIAKEEGMIVDGTCGDGGHTRDILEHTGPGLRVLALDRDEAALQRARGRLKKFGHRVRFVHANFSHLRQVLRDQGLSQIDGLLLDLGVSSLQLEDPRRGFSFQKDGPLDMRMDPSQGPTAADLLEQFSDEELTRIIKEYGEERHPKRIVRAIRKAQATSPILTTLRLSKALSGAVPPSRSSKIHPATRTFQALRIAVNSELANLQTALQDSLGVLNAGARLLVIAFHSLEDRIVKDFFRTEEKGCICPPRFPACVCGRKTTLKILTRRPVRPAPEEVKRNPRASSAKLRAAERVYA